MTDAQIAFDRLLTIMDELRAGCPWDRKQTLQSLRNLTLEETYELADAILDEDLTGIKEEIGDIMLHMVFYAKIASEQKAWNISDALNAVCEKLINRHPHIYGDLEVDGEEEVKQNWEKIKQKEKRQNGKVGSVLGGVPNSLPAMVKAFRMQDKTKQVGFEWESRDQVWSKVQEEIQELNEVIETGNQAAIEDEFGDVLFSLINYARFIHVDPETALEKVNRKFKRRFEYIEANAPKALEDMTLQEMDALWNDAKGLQNID